MMRSWNRSWLLVWLWWLGGGWAVGRALANLDEEAGVGLGRFGPRA